MDRGDGRWQRRRSGNSDDGDDGNDGDDDGDDDDEDEDGDDDVGDTDGADGDGEDTFLADPLAAVHVDCSLTTWWLIMGCMVVHNGLIQPMG